MDRWTEKDAKDWWQSRRWVCGFNFLPSNAVNFIEMWHRDTFDLPTIERELSWANKLGFNTLRVNLSYLVWKHDRDGLWDRVDRVIGVAERHGLRTVPVPFDDCGFGGNEPTYGPQGEPVPGVHNSRAVASPGRALLASGREDGLIRDYARDLLTTFRNDPRIAFWDLYNEPGNRMVFGPNGSATSEPDFTGDSVRLMQDSFAIARDVDPSHPLTVAAWAVPQAGQDTPAFATHADTVALALSDITTFHAYLSTEKVEALIDNLEDHERPILCTEWMARAVGSRIVDQLRMFRARNVGCFQWGLVQGRTQTWLPWPDDLVRAHGGAGKRDMWFHDLLDGSGTPYDPLEVETLLDCVQQP